MRILDDITPPKYLAEIAPLKVNVPPVLPPIRTLKVVAVVALDGTFTENVVGCAAKPVASYEGIAPIAEAVLSLKSAPVIHEEATENEAK
jgi:hypothetical protein